MRWTAKENMKTFLRLLKEKKIKMEPIITQVFDFNKAVEVYEKLYKGELKGAIGIAFKYSPINDIERLRKEHMVIEIKPAMRTSKAKEEKKDKVRIGFIGAGQHAQGTLLPILKKMKDLELVGVATTTPAKVAQIAKRWGFKYATTNPDKIIEDPDIDAVFVVTRHDTHAYYTVKALEAGKYVFVEKPLAVTLEQLEQVRKTLEKNPGKLMIGFNRRYAPYTQEAKKILQNRTEPITMLIRVNAGYTPQDHWIYDPKQGGGRIISETCHFIDLAIYLTESKPIDYTVTVMNKAPRYHITDNHIITLKHEDGSIATIVYTSQGTRAYPRELIEIFAQETAININNFRTLSIKGKNKKKHTNIFGADRGHKRMLEFFIGQVKSSEEIPETLESSYWTIRIVKNILNK